MRSEELCKKSSPPRTRNTVAAAAVSAATAACGGGGTAAAQPTADATVTAVRASRFLAQASMGATPESIERVMQIGYAAWLDEQFDAPHSGTRWDWLVAKGFDATSFKNTQQGFDACAWRKLISAPDTLRQRVTLALSEILVVSVDGLANAGGWRSFGGAAWLDMLEAHAFGKLRELLQAATLSLQLGVYLSTKGNAKANPVTGSQPDENYARELMQLFSIGLTRMALDGTPLPGPLGNTETYTPDDIAGLARVFTGWDTDLAGGTNDIPAYHRRPMIQVAKRFETGEKQFLGLLIPANTDAFTGLSLALDHLFAHPNIAPFWSRQLIQRLVSSNPSPAYVQRVAQVFVDDGSGQRGNLRAVLRAVLLDVEARSDAALAQPMSGKLREPVLRYTAWARAFGANSATDAWALGNTSDPATKLGQAPLRSPSVFNFFRPGYVPPNSALADAALVAPEFQITHESSVVGYINFMQRAVGSGIGDIKADYSAWLPKAFDSAALASEINTLLAAGQLGASSLQHIVSAVATMPSDTDAALRQRVQATVLLTLAAPEFLVLK